jgi:DNA polymerase-3 subunit delta'
MRDVAGHAGARTLLSQALAADIVSHSYLFTGPEGVGKTTLALAFAQLLLCRNPNLQTGDACGECDQCRKILHGTHPDLAVIEAEEGRRLLGVDLIRESVIRVANLAPSEAHRRVFILPDVQLMTASTTNALLKTLEEPPEGVVLLLTSTDEESLLPTLVSRCQTFHLHLVPEQEIEELLSLRFQAAPAEASLLAGIAEGRPGWAIRALSRPEMREERNQWLTQIAGLVSSGLEERLRAAATMSKDAETARQVLELWTIWWRDVLLSAAKATHLMNAGQLRDEAERLGRILSFEQAQTFIHALLAARESLEQNVNARLIFDALMFDLPQP